MATYPAPIVPALRGQLSSEVIRDQFGLISTAFSLQPDVLGSGSKGFTGGEWTDATLTAPVIAGGTLGNPSFMAVAITAYHIFGKTAQYDAGLNTGYVGLVRDLTGKLRLWDGARTKLFTDDAHSLVMGSGASEMALSSAEGHLYVPSVNGVATGAPTAYTGAIPLIVDRLTKKIGLYIGGAWVWTAALS